jgi:hypothetical protein
MPYQPVPQYDESVKAACQNAQLADAYQGIQSAAAQEKMGYLKESTASGLAGSAQWGGLSDLLKQAQDLTDGLDYLAGIAKRGVAGYFLSPQEIQILAAFVLGVNTK